MSRMSNLALTIKEFFTYAIVVFTIVVIAFLVHAQRYSYVKDKENRINVLEQRLTLQEHYMHQVQADIDNLYRVVE